MWFLYEALKLPELEKRMLFSAGQQEGKQLMRQIVLFSEIFHSKIYSEKMKHDIISVRDTCLGPKELRTRAAPIKIGSKYLGGTHFERNDGANPVKPNTRCYTIGNTFEGPTKIMAPCKDGKLTGDGNMEALQLRSDLLKVKNPLFSLR